MAGEGQREIIELMRSILGESFAQLAVKRVLIEENLEQGMTFEENLEQGMTSITCEVTERDSEENSVIAARGVGVIDALFNGLVERFGSEYPSLKTIQFKSFRVGAQIETKSGFAGTDSQGEVVIEIENSEGRLFNFCHSSRSVLASMIVTTLRAVEYFVNAERAYITIYEAHQDAVQRDRTDLVQRYLNQMAVLVRSTSYSEVIERIRKKMS